MTDRLRLEYVDPASLGPNPLNWRVHPADQRAAFVQLLDQVGWVAPLYFNEGTANLLDGHMRREEAIRLGLPAIPVVIGSWSPEQERTILATLDPLAMMAEADKGAFAKLLEQLETTGPELLGLLGDTADWAGLYKGLDDAPCDGEQPVGAKGLDEESGTDTTEPISRADVPDTVFPSSNAWGIPDLDIKRQADAIDFPVTQWATQGAGRPMTGTWCFYVDDRRFNSLWDDPSPVLKAGAINVVEPNFSTHEQHPRALVLWRIYQKRWLARWWQTQGLKVFVDLNVAAPFADLALLGVPKGWRAYATRAHDQGAGIEAQYEQAVRHADTRDILYLVYGGGKAVVDLCAANGWKHIPEQYDAAKQRIKDQAKQKEAADGRK